MDAATLNSCIASTASGDSIVLGADISLASTPSTLAAGVVFDTNTHTLVTGNTAWLSTNTINFNGGKISTSSNQTLLSSLDYKPGQSSIAAAAGTTLTVTPDAIETNGIGIAVFGSSTETGTVVLNVATGISLALSTNYGLRIAGGTLRAGVAGRFSDLTLISGSTTVDAGATLDLNGFYSEVRGLQGAGTVQTGTDATSVLRLSGGNFGGNITGSGNVSAASTVLTGTNTYTGTTVIDTSSLQIGNGGTTGTLGSGNVLINQIFGFNPRLVLNRSDNTTVANNISGNGGVTQNGSGTVTLTGNNTYSGGTIINSGAISVGAAGVLGTGDIALSGGKLSTSSNLTLSNSSVTFTAGQSGTVNAATGTTLNLSPTSLIFGANSNAIFGSTGENGTVALGSLSLSVDPTATMRVAAGTLVNGGLSGLATTIVASTTVDAGATLDFNSFTGSIKNLLGAGTVQTGNDTTQDLFITNGNFSGTIAGVSRLNVQAGGALILSGANTYSGRTVVNGTLQIGNGGASGTLGTSTTVDLAGTLAFNRAGTATVLADINGAGSLVQQGSGTVVLTGANTYTGVTTISSGILQVGDGGTAGSLGSGSVTNNASLVFNRADSTTVGNAVSGSGGLTQAGAATLTLTGNNTYSGTTAITSGTLQVGNGGTSGTLGAGLVNNATSLVFNRADSSAATGSITGVGTVLKQGGGALTLSGANTYGGATTVAAGTLQAGASNTFSASSAMTVNGGATLDLNGLDQTVASLAGAGNVSLGSGTLGAGDPTSTAFSGAITGSGGFTKQGAGTFTLTGTNIYTGATTLASGILQVGSGGTTGSLGSGSVVNNASLVFNRSDGVTVGNAMSGSGSLTHAGAGTLTLTGNNSYGGLTTVGPGVLQVGNGGTTGALGSGNIVNGGALVFNRSDVLTVGNAIQSTGSLTQNGTGNLVLSGASSYSGATTVNAGTLSVNGSIASNTLVNSGGILGGSGTVASTTVNSGGILAPGNSIGTLTVNGNLTFNPGSILRVETDAAGTADRVNVVGAPGTLTINGGTVQVLAGSGTYQRNTQYTLLTSTGATSGTFSSVSSNLAFLTPTLIYQPNAVLLNLQSSAVQSYTSVAHTYNQRQVAQYLNGFADNPGSASAAQLIGQIDNLTPAQARAAFDGLSGSQHAAASQMVMGLGREFSAITMSHAGSRGAEDRRAQPAGLKLANLNYASVASAQSSNFSSTQSFSLTANDQNASTAGSTGLWSEALGFGGKSASDGNGPTSSYRASGLIVGLNHSFGESWLIGVALGYLRTAWDANTNSIAPSTGRIDTPMAALYGRYSSGPWQSRLTVDYARPDFTASRSIDMGGSVSSASSAHRGSQWGVAAETEYAMPAGAWEVRPLARLRYARLSEEAFRESGSAATALTVAARRGQSTTASLGARFLRPFADGKGEFELDVTASHLFGANDLPVNATLAGQTGSFNATGTPVGRNALTLGAGVATRISQQLSGYAAASYEVRNAGQRSFAARVGLRMTW